MSRHHWPIDEKVFEIKNEYQDNWQRILLKAANEFLYNSDYEPINFEFTFGKLILKYREKIEILEIPDH